jgi:hypothetical protein
LHPRVLRRGYAAAIRSIIIVTVWTTGRSGSAVIAGSVTRRVIGTRGGGTDCGSTDGGSADAYRHARAYTTIKASAVNATTIDAAAVDTTTETSAIRGRVS